MSNWKVSYDHRPYGLGVLHTRARSEAEAIQNIKSHLGHTPSYIKAERGE